YPVGQVAGAHRHAERGRLCLRAFRGSARRDKGRRGHDLPLHLERAGAVLRRERFHPLHELGGHGEIARLGRGTAGRGRGVARRCCQNLPFPPSGRGRGEGASPDRGRLARKWRPGRPRSLKDYSTSSTFSGGRPSAALLPETTIGRSTMMGCFAIAAISCSSDSFAGSMPASAASFLRRSARAGIFNCPSSVFSCAAVYGVFRYSTISGSTPLSRNKASVLSEVLQRGLG